MPRSVRILPDIQRALDARGPVVALESSVLAQGLPSPQNREAAQRMTAAVRDAGGIPAITAVVTGEPALGLTEAELERFLTETGIRKVSARDLAAAVQRKVDGATTVAASVAIAALARVQVFATGGIGGVHRGAPFDESADLNELANTPIVVVCAGAKSILDLDATIERLETLGVLVVGYRTDELPGFFTAETGIKLGARADSPMEIAAIFDAQRALGRRQALLVVQAPPANRALPRAMVDRAVEQAITEAARRGIHGAALTPYLLSELVRLTGGGSLAANLALLEQNALLAGEIALALSQ